MRRASSLVTSLIRAPSKQHTSIECQVGRWVPLYLRVSPTISHHLFLAMLVVIRGTDLAALLSSSVSPDVMGLSPSVCGAVKWFCKGTSAFGGSLFLLLVLATASFHPSALLAPLPSVRARGGIFGCLAAGPLQAALGTSYLTPSQPP